MDIMTVLEKQELFESGKPATTEEILEAEEALTVTFAEEYRCYLQKYGCASFKGHILTGISPFPGIDVVTVTEEMRRMQPHVPHEYYVIEETQMDGIVIWQSSDGAIYVSNPASQPRKIASSLAEYIEQ